MAQHVRMGEQGQGSSLAVFPQKQIDGRAVRGHVMDPDTGWPADGLVQVTVVARTGIEADALSTAMLVSGRPTEGVLRFFTG